MVLTGPRRTRNMHVHLPNFCVGPVSCGLEGESGTASCYVLDANFAATTLTLADVSWAASRELALGLRPRLK